MAAKCPNFADRDVRELFNELVEQLGGRPMGKTEGLSEYLFSLKPEQKVAFNAAHALWDVHDNPLDAIDYAYSLNELQKPRGNTNPPPGEIKPGASGSTPDPTKGLGASNGYNINDSAMKSSGVEDFPKTPITPSTQPQRTMFGKLFGSDTPPEVKAAATAADHWHRMWKYLSDLRATSDANPHIEPLQRYEVTLDEMNRFAAERQINAEDTLKAGWKLSSDEQGKLYKLIDDYMNMRYLPKDQLDKGNHRKPTINEFKKMVADSGVGEQGIGVFRKMLVDFENFAKEVTKVLREKAGSIADPTEQAKELSRIDALEKGLLAKPYFPAMRFGLFTVLVKGPEGHAFFRAESAREQKKIAKRLERSLKPGETLELSKLPESVSPFSGLPVPLLEAIERRLKLSPEQIAALQQLKYEVSPVRSFAHRFQNRDLVPGYSKDFFRAYANYFFHGARYLARAKFVDQLQQASKDLWDSSRGVPDGVKRAEISQFVQDHLDQVLNPSPDWSIPRAFAFHWILGFRVASAGVNLTQTLVSTYPHIATEFGDARAVKAMTKATADFRNFYKHTTVQQMPEREMRALSELSRLGVIRGALAPELAGMSEGRNLLRGYGSTKSAAVVNTYLKLSQGLFELAEQTNRRIAGMSTYELALRNPTAKFVRDAAERDPALVTELMGKGFPENEANAITAAKRMIDRTQFQMTRAYRPRYMRGPVGSTVFVFKLFTHRMLWNLYNYPAAAMRTMLTMGFLGGLMGIPGMQDINGLLKAAGWWFLGKDFDLEDEAKKFAVDVLGMKGGKGVFDDPYTLVRGVAAHGYGIPALLDMIGEWSGVGHVPYPTLDRGQAVAMQNVLPLDFGQAFGPRAYQRPIDAFAKGVSQGTGAFGSLAFNVYQAINNARVSPDDFKRWERVLPVSVAGLSRAIRTYRNEGLQGQTGTNVVKFDPRDPEQMAEIIAMGMGYQPLRVSKTWNRIMNQQEAVAYWNIRREMLLNQFWAARGDPEERKHVLGAIKNFNNEVQGTEARLKAITTDTLQKSMQSRMQATKRYEAGSAIQKSDIPIIRDVQRLYPGATFDVRKTQ